MTQQNFSDSVFLWIPKGDTSNIELSEHINSDRREKGDALTNSGNISDRAAIKSLGKGESITFPIEKLHTIRTTVSDFNTIHGSKYLTTTTDRDARTIKVTRVS